MTSGPSIAQHPGANAPGCPIPRYRLSSFRKRTPHFVP
jgi:hypothetical protein